MKLFKYLFGRRRSANRSNAPHRPGVRLESLEARHLMASDVAPVLMVIADQRDFYYTEYYDTRLSIEAAGLDVTVAARTTNPSTPHANTGQGPGVAGTVDPDIALADVDPDDYSAIVFVGGWGSSMYQYAFTGDYYDDLYDGDPATKETVNQLIDQFLDDDKYVGAICHAVTILAWARRDGASPLDGKQVSVPYIGSPGVYYNNTWYAHYELSQYEQVVENGAIANTASGQYGNPLTVADDVLRDGRIITAENYDAAAHFGVVVAESVLEWAASLVPPPPENQPPVAADSAFQLAENSAVGTVVGVVTASDPDAGQSLAYTIVAGNESGAFAIDPATGQITVADPSALDFETNPEFVLEIQVSDNGALPLALTCFTTISLLDQLELAPGTAQIFNGDLYVQGTAAGDTIYLWNAGTHAETYVWINGVQLGVFILAPDADVVVYGGDGNDRIFATDMRRGVTLYGQGGHDQLTGSRANDTLDGGDGVDRLWGGMGDDVIYGGAGNDFLHGREGADSLFGGDGNDHLDGFTGTDLLVGGFGSDRLDGGLDDDLLYGGSPDAPVDGAVDVLIGRSGADSNFADALDAVYADAFDLLEIF